MHFCCCCVLFQLRHQETPPPPPCIVSDAAPPPVVISTCSTKVCLTFQFSRWQVKAQQGSWSGICSFDVCGLPGRTKTSAQNVCWGSGCKVPVQSCAPGSWKPIWALKKKKKALSYSVNCCKSIRWKDKIWHGPDGRPGLMGSQRAWGPELTSVCLLVMNEKVCVIRFFMCSYDDFYQVFWSFKTALFKQLKMGGFYEIQQQLYFKVQTRLSHIKEIVPAN